MSTKKDYYQNCFSPNWIEIDLEKVEKQQKQKGESPNKNYRKDLKTLLRELDEIRQNIEMVADKQQRLANLMGFYTGEFAQ